ncbi:hypothetical protein BUALT_Bualt19G0027400 [Buddleja alternifolia]|uniref:Uncharacterized protein n=1 Tax=Buddleja alternifolia TaxID=168488 RepID=A0AAV6W1I4_9LAMI|nr:hypothetical protein BUALT_Bualt19G0027400 [Buddleja alternifolia]
MVKSQQDRRKSDTQLPPPLLFPRSVSPYISRRKSDTAATWQPQGHHHRRFFSTPQVGPTAEIEKKKKSNKFSSLFLGLFRSKSAKPESNSGPISGTAVSVDSCSASPSWFPNLISGRRKKNTRTFSIGEQRQTRRNRDRGMSPARHDGEDAEHSHGESSGYSSETPRRTPANMRRGGGRAAGHSKNVSGMVFCLSPLVRPSPNLHRNQKCMPPDTAVAGESRPHLSQAPSFCKNRSRKLADFGRYYYNPNH